MSNEKQLLVLHTNWSASRCSVIRRFLYTFYHWKHKDKYKLAIVHSQEPHYVQRLESIRQYYDDKRTIVLVPDNLQFTDDFDFDSALLRSAEPGVGIVAVADKADNLTDKDGIVKSGVMRIGGGFVLNPLVQRMIGRMPYEPRYKLDDVAFAAEVLKYGWKNCVDTGSIAKTAGRRGVADYRDSDLICPDFVDEKRLIISNKIGFEAIRREYASKGWFGIFDDPFELPQPLQPMMTQAEFLEFVENAKWRFARTYAKTAPHEYAVVKEDAEESQYKTDLFRAAKWTLLNGYIELYYTAPFVYCRAGDHRYWTYYSLNLINRSLIGDENKIYR
ncbi:MAG: hypothetical protein LBP59_10560 [Planctomycetaceae bacterium]|jgi:hypothetical protein|nr:hypothetical protein [Planctomycetaceae bacterium]